jgi:hypothetical protein
MPLKPDRRVPLPRPLRLALAALLAGTLAACGDAGDPTGAPSPQTTLAAAQSSQAAGSPSAVPSPVNETRPPKATQPSKAGYLWVFQADGSFTAATAYQFNSAGGPITVEHQGTGQYRVTYAGLGDPGGVAHAQAYGSAGDFCAVQGWAPNGPDQQVDVACFDPGGAPADRTFVTNFAAGSQDTVRFSYLVADQPNNAARYQPAAARRYDDVAPAETTARRTDLGRYEVHLPAAVRQPGEPYTVQITAYGSAGHCKLSTLDEATGTALVACRSAGGSYVDTRFALSYAAGGSHLGRSDRRFAEYTSASTGVTSPSEGTYVIRATGLGQARGQVVALATGADDGYCHVAGWTVVGADLDMRVACFEPGGVAASGDFLLGVTW